MFSVLPGAIICLHQADTVSICRCTCTLGLTKPVVLRVDLKVLGSRDMATFSYIYSGALRHGWCTKTPKFHISFILIATSLKFENIK